MEESVGRYYNLSDSEDSLDNIVDY